MSIRSIAIVACPLLFAAHAEVVQKEQPDPELASAREKYTKPEEKNANDATDICVRKNNAAAVDVMLEVLRMEQERGGGLPPGHYRDIAWGGLARITDPYARREVEAELKSGKSSALVKQWCAELLGEYGDVEFGATLLAAMHDKDLGIQRAAARALGKVRYEPAATVLLKQIGDKDIYLRANAIESLARIDSTVHKGVLERALKDKDGGVRCALLGVAGEIYGDAAEPWDVAALADKDWRPRLQAVDNLEHVRTKTSVDALIGALDDGRPVVAARALKYLQELTGEKHRAKEAWVRWWTEHRESFAFPDGSSKSSEFDEGATVSYHGIQLTSDHVAFLLDGSDEMDKKLKSKDVTKRAAALKELDDVMSKLEGRLTFNVMTYAENVRTFEEKGPVELNARTRKKALEFVESAPRGNRKDIWKLLEQVITDPDLDTAYLLSSGEPDIGLYVHWNRVTWHLKELNRFQKVVVHTIAYSDSEWYRSQIQKIAEATGGEYRWFE